MKRIIAFSSVLALAVGCNERSATPTNDLSQAVAFNADGAPIVEFSVPDMMCAEGCGVTVKGILSKQPGVKEVVVDFDTKTATLAIEQDKFDAEQALAALVDKRFDHSTLKTDAAATPTAAAAPVNP